MKPNSRMRNKSIRLQYDGPYAHMQTTGTKNALAPKRMGAWSPETASFQNGPAPDLRQFSARPPHTK